MNLLRLGVIGVACAVIVRGLCALAGVPWEFAFVLSVLAAWLSIVWVDRPRDRQKSGET